ncbi:MAG TPA: MOSC domain-containing protein [Isosphaeraceae bacterium]
MPQSSVESIFLHGPKGEAMTRVDEATARAGQGLEGDRYFKPEGNEPDREITLIEAEAVEALARDEKVPFEVAESRRNVVTRGVALNHLVGREFSVGAARLRVIRLCEPCDHLQKLTRPGVLKGLLHRGGLRARIVADGPIRVGDPVVMD